MGHKGWKAIDITVKMYCTEGLDDNALIFMQNDKETGLNVELAVEQRQ